MKKYLIGLALIIVPLLASALIVPSFVDWNRYKIEITAYAKDLTGRDVVIDGDIAFSVLPAPALSVDQVRVANLPGANSVDMLALKSLEIRVAFLPLLRGQIRVEKVVLIEPVIELEILSDGQRNWDIAAGKTPAPDSAADDEAGGLTDVQLDSFVIQGGRLTYRDRASGQILTIENLDASVSAETLRGPIQVEGGFEYLGLPMTFKVNAGQFANGRAFPVNLALNLGPSNADLSLSGTVRPNRPDDMFSGRLTLSGSDFAGAIGDFAALAGQSVRPGAIGALARPFKVTAEVATSESRAELNAIELQLGPGGEQLSARGSAALSFGDIIGVEAKLAINRVDLDALLDSGGQPGPGAGDAGQPSELALPGDDNGFSLPADFFGQVDLTIAALTYRESAVRQIRIAAELKDGKVELKWATAQLPGSSDVSLNGVLIAEDGAPRFDGKLKAASNNLRTLLSWLDMDQASVPPDRLTKIALSGDLTVTDDVVQLYGLDIGLDTSRITGGLALALRTRPSFSIDLDIDRLNVDAYMPPEAPDSLAKSTAETSAETPATEGLADLRPLSGLDDFDSNLKLRIGRLTYRRINIDDVAVDASLVGGVLAVRNLSAGDMAGTRLALKGSAGNFSAKPSIMAEIDIESDNLSVFERMFEFELPVSAADLGPAVIKATIEGGLEDQFEVDIDLALGATKTRAIGKVADLATLPRFNLTLDVSNPSLTGAIAQFGIETNPPVAGFDRPVGLKGTVSGDLGSLDVNVALMIAGGRFTVAGNLAPTAVEPTFDLNLGVQHDDLVGLARGLGYDYRPAFERLGGIDFAGHVQSGPEGVVISGLNGNIGPASLEGEVNLQFAGAKPKLTAKLAAGEIVTDFFMEPKATGARQARATAAPVRWSTEPLDLAVLDQFDADIELTARRLVFGAYEFVTPELSVQLADGTLEVRRLAGKLFDGDVLLAAEVKASDGMPSVSLSVTLKNASLEKALRASADLSLATGTFDMTGDFKAAGASQFDMVSALDGEARVAAREGVIRGIDLPRLNEEVKNVNGRSDILRLIGAGLSGGETPYTSLSGRLVFVDGVATTQDVDLDIDGATATVNAVIDLPKWWVDAQARFRLADHPDMPPLGMDIRGPLYDPDSTVLNQAFVSLIVKRLGAAALRKVFNRPTGGLKELLGLGGPQAQPEPASVEPSSENQDPGQKLLDSILQTVNPQPIKDEQKPPN